MDSRGVVQYEPVALGVHRRARAAQPIHAPEVALGPRNVRRARQASARTQPRVLAKFVTGIDYLVPFLDIGIIFFWVPGVILFVFGYPLIFGWWSMLLLPITLVDFGLLRRWQEQHVFRRLDIHPEADRRGFIGYLFAYQVLSSSASLRGYAQHSSDRAVAGSENEKSPSRGALLKGTTWLELTTSVPRGRPCSPSSAP